MAARGRTVPAGRVGRPHGLDGAFVLREGRAELSVGAPVLIAGHRYAVAGVAGSVDRPLIRLEGVADREAAARLTGEPLEVEASEDPPGPDEWLVDDLIGCEVAGLGEVRRVVGGSSCDVLELDDATLVPLVSDAIIEIDTERRSIVVDLGFLGRAEDRSA